MLSLLLEFWDSTMSAAVVQPWLPALRNGELHCGLSGSPGSRSVSLLSPCSSPLSPLPPSVLNEVAAMRAGRANCSTGTAVVLKVFASREN